MGPPGPILIWENFTSRGVFSGVTSNHMPGKLPRTISLLLQLLKISRMCLSRSWEALAVKMICAELLNVSRVKTKSNTFWQEKLGRTFVGQKFTFIRTRAFLTNQEHDVFFGMLHYLLKTGKYFSSWARLHMSLDWSFYPGR